MLVLHANPIQLGVLGALQTLPFPILGMIVGVLADRLPRRAIMIVADVVRFLALAAIPAAAVFGRLDMALLYAVSLVTGCASAFFGITYQSYLPVIVSTDALTSANTKLEFSNSGTNMAGNALAGVLVQWIGAPLTIAVDACTYTISVLSLLLIRAPEPAHEGPPLSARQAFVEIFEGIRVVTGSRDLRWIALATATVNFGGGMLNAVFFIYAYRLLHLQPGLLGLVGGIAGGCMLLAQVMQPYVVFFLVTAVVAVTIPIYNVNQISYRQTLVDVRMQGRMNATMRTFVWGTVPLGAFIGRNLGMTIGAPATIALGAASSMLAALLVLPLRERTLASE